MPDSADGGAGVITRSHRDDGAPVPALRLEVVPALDGFRGLAVVLVVVVHLQLLFPFRQTGVGVIDGFVYLGTAVQSFALGTLTGMDWAYWPLFLLPFAILGFVLLTRIWNASASKGGGH